MRRLPAFALASAFALALLAPRAASAGGGPMNVMVVYSSDDAGATGVAQHYGTARSLPVGHLCGIPGVVAGTTTIDFATYQTLIQAPVDACLAALPQPDEIDYLVLVRGLPYAVTLPSGAASLEAVIQIAHTTETSTMMELAGQGQPGTMSNAAVPNPAFPQGVYFDTTDSTVTNMYSAWYALGDAMVRQSMQSPSFHRATAADSGGYHFAGNLFIVQSLDGFDDTDATALVDRGVASDGTFPTAELLCMAAEDSARGARDPECEEVTRFLTAAGLAGTYVSAFDATLSGHTVAGYFTGSAGGLRTAIAGNTFVPGAIVDNLTSFGAAISNFSCNGSTCPGSENQVSIARFIRAGATGAHGTVNEPLNNVFPNAGAYLHYTFGYSMGESYFFNQRFLYWQNIHLGDPLATPYAQRPAVTIGGSAMHPANEPLVISATHPNGVSRIDLYEAGKRVATAMSDTLMYELTEPVGQSLDLLAVAVATNAPVTRTGWPTPMQLPTPDVQGWTTMTVTVAPAQAASTGTGGSTSNSGNGGASGSSGAGSTANGSGGDGTGGGHEGSGGSTGASGAGGSANGANKPSSGCKCRAAGTAGDGEGDAHGAALGVGALALLARRRPRRRNG